MSKSGQNPKSENHSTLLHETKRIPQKIPPLSQSHPIDIPLIKDEPLPNVLFESPIPKPLLYGNTMKMLEDLHREKSELESNLKQKEKIIEDLRSKESQEILRLKSLLKDCETGLLNRSSLKPEKIESEEQGKYHGVISIDQFRDIKDVNKGWTIEFPTYSEVTKDIFEVVGTTNAFLTVTGAYDKGKTFLLNKICKSRFPSGKKVETKGISFKKTNIKGTEVIIIDSAGSHSPIKVNETIEEKRETEKRLRDVIFLLSDFFILVVNDYTTLDQEILEKLEKQLQGNKNKKNKEIIIVHNLKDVYNEDDMQFIWKKQIEGLYIEEQKEKQLQRQEFALRQACEIDGHIIHYLKTEFSRHVMLVNDNSDFGRCFNDLVVKMITMWIQTSCVNYKKRNFFENFFDILSQNLKSHKNSADNKETDDESIFFQDKGLLVTKLPNKNCLKLVCNDNIVNDVSVLPDFYEPALDIIENEEFYIIFIDAPGIEPFDVALSENHVTFTLTRKRQFGSGYKISERAFGECTKSFKIPPKFNYEPEIEVENGVVKLLFRRKEFKTRAVKF